MPKGHYDRSKSKPRKKSIPAEADVHTESGRRPPGYWDTHGGQKAKNKEAWENRKKRLAEQGLNSNGKPCKPRKKGSAGAKALSHAFDLNKPQPEGTYVRKDEAPVEQSEYVEKRPVMARVSFEAMTAKLMPEIAVDVLVSVVDSLQPSHLEQLDQVIVDHLKRGEALKLMRDIVAIKCGHTPPVQTLSSPPVQALSPVPKPQSVTTPPPVNKRPRKPYTRKTNTARGTDVGGTKPYVRPEEPTDHLKVPSPEDAEIPYNEKPAVSGEAKPIPPAQLELIDRKRKLVADYLAHEVDNEPTRPMFLMGECAIGGNIWKKVIEHPWFIEDLSGIRLSELGLAVHRPNEDVVVRDVETEKASETP